MSADREGAGCVLIVEDSEAIRDILCRVLLDGGFEVAAAGTGQQGMELASSGCFDVLVVDLGLPDMKGQDLIRSLRLAGNHSRIAVLSGLAGSLDADEFRELGVDRILPKPMRLKEMLDEVRGLVAAGRLAAEEVRQ
jgi:DNA-binding response OmpR family regulator